MHVEVSYIIANYRNGRIYYLEALQKLRTLGIPEDVIKSLLN